MFLGSKSSNIALFWPLRGQISWPVSSDQKSKLRIPYLALYLSTYMFFGSSSSNMVLFFLLTTQRSNIMTSEQRSELKIPHLALCMSKYMFLVSRNWNMALVFPDQRSKLKIPYLAWCMSKYMFLGSRSSNMAFVFHFDLSGSPLMTSYLQWVFKTQYSLIGIMQIKIYVLGVQELKYGIGFSFWPLRGHLSWPKSSDQRSTLKIPYLAVCMSL